MHYGQDVTPRQPPPPSRRKSLDISRLNLSLSREASQSPTGRHGRHSRSHSRHSHNESCRSDITDMEGPRPTSADRSLATSQETATTPADTAPLTETATSTATFRDRAVGLVWKLLRAIVQLSYTLATALVRSHPGAVCCAVCAVLAWCYVLPETWRAVARWAVSGVSGLLVSMLLMLGGSSPSSGALPSSLATITTTATSVATSTRFITVTAAAGTSSAGLPSPSSWPVCPAFVLAPLPGLDCDGQSENSRRRSGVCSPALFLPLQLGDRGDDGLRPPAHSPVLPPRGAELQALDSALRRLVSDQLTHLGDVLSAVLNSNAASSIDGGGGDAAAAAAPVRTMLSALADVGGALDSPRPLREARALVDRMLAEAAEMASLPPPPSARHHVSVLAAVGRGVAARRRVMDRAARRLGGLASRPHVLGLDARMSGAVEALGRVRGERPVPASAAVTVASRLSGWSSWVSSLWAPRAWHRRGDEHRKVVEEWRLRLDEAEREVDEVQRDVWAAAKEAWEIMREARQDWAEPDVDYDEDEESDG